MVRTVFKLLRLTASAPWLALLVLAVVFGGVREAEAKLRIVATVPDLAAIAQAVAGERGEVTSLSLGSQDPHFVDARPHLVLKLNRADLLLLVGLDLELGWLPVLVTGARNAKLQPGTDHYLDASTLVPLKQVPQLRVDRSQGDIHPGGNPHYLIDPDNARRIALGVAERLSRIDPGHRTDYQRNAAALSKALAAAQARWRTALAPFAGTPVVGFHNAWIYFTDAFGLQIIGYLEPKPGIPPNAAHLLRLIRRMQDSKVQLILQKEYYPDRAAQIVAQKTGATLLRLCGGTRVEQGESYLARMDTLVGQVAAALHARTGVDR